MEKKTLCFLVLGASVGVLLQNLAQRRYMTTARPVMRTSSAEVIDLAAWKELKNRNQLAV
jgi:hypothetical protein